MKKHKFKIGETITPKKITSIGGFKRYPGTAFISYVDGSNNFYVKEKGCDCALRNVKEDDFQKIRSTSLRKHYFFKNYQFFRKDDCIIFGIAKLKLSFLRNIIKLGKILKREFKESNLAFYVENNKFNPSSTIGVFIILEDDNIVFDFDLLKVTNKELLQILKKTK